MTTTTPDLVSPEDTRRPSARISVRTVRRASLKATSAVLVLIAAASVTFFAQLLIPGDRATTILNLLNGRDQKWTPEELAPVNDRFGFDQSLIVQYLQYVGGFFKGDLGTSYTQYRPVTSVIGAQILP